MGPSHVVLFIQNPGPLQDSCKEDFQEYLRLPFPSAWLDGGFDWTRQTQREYLLHRRMYFWNKNIIAATCFKCFEPFTASKGKYIFSDNVYLSF